MRAPLFLMLLLTACATTSADQNVRSCEPLPVADCLALLDQRKLQEQSVNDVLMAVAAVYIAEENPRPPIDYLEAVTDRDKKSAPAYRGLGEAFSMLARQQLTKFSDVNRLLSEANYVIASSYYAMAFASDPSDQPSYLDAARTAAEAGACDIATSVRNEHAKHFGQNDYQEDLVAIVKKRCG